METWRPGQTYSVGFQTGGQVTDIEARVGETVTKGQVLAHLDPTMDKANLASAQLALTSAQAHLAQVEQVLTPQQRAQNATSLASAQTVGELRAHRRRQRAEDGFDRRGPGATGRRRRADEARQRQCRSRAVVGGLPDQSALTQAQNQQVSGDNKDQQAITQAQSQLTQANNQLNSTIASNAASAQLLPSDLDAAKASVAQAQVQVMSATQNVGWTTLVAPANGVVTAINGTVGQTVSGSGVSTSSGSTTAGAASSGSASSSSSGSSSAFLTITNVDALSVKAGFAETDATKLQIGQPATVSFSALSTVQAAGTVTNVDLDSTLVSNVVTYYATIALTKVPTGVKPGMTASATVTVDKREGVLDLPSAAVRGTGTVGAVTVVNGAVQTTKSVGVGLRGDTTTEITSGLNVGDTVVISSGTVSGVSTQLGTGGRFGTGGFGGLGGAGLGGAGRVAAGAPSGSGADR